MVYQFAAFFVCIREEASLFDKRSLKMSKKKTHEEFLEELFEVNKNIDILEQYNHDM